MSVDDAGEGVLSAFAANVAEAPACDAYRVPSILFASVSEVEDTLWQLIFTRGSSFAPKSTADGNLAVMVMFRLDFSQTKILLQTQSQK